MKTIKHLGIASLFVGLASTAAAQSTLHYWDFSTQDDSVGGVTAAAVGTPDLSLHATYGEAYPGSGPSLNTIEGALGAGVGGGVLDADVFDTGPTAMNFGTSNFSFSYWVYDDLASNGNLRGPRVFDSLAPSLTEGIQLASNATGVLNLRIDDDAGASVLSNSTITLVPPTNVWTHMAYNIDRVSQTVTVYVDGVSATSYSIAALTGGIAPSQDMRIGGINAADNQGGAQNQGLDDLAFYDALLSPAQIAGLATGTLTPLDFAVSMSTFCDPANLNCLGASTTLSGNFGTGIGSDLHLSATNGPSLEFGYFLVSNAMMDPGTVLSNGNFCLTSTFGRYNAPGTQNSIGQFSADGLTFTNLVGTGTSAGGTGFDVPSVVPVMGSPMIMSGETWHFQLWHRDTCVASDMSNLSNGLSVTF